MAPKPPTLGSAPAPPWRSSISLRRLHGGPEMAPKPPTLGSAPAPPWRSSISLRRLHGAPKWPQAPNARKRPGTAVALLDDAAERLLVACATRIRLGVREAGDEPAGGAQELSVAVARADQLDAEG